MSNERAARTFDQIVKALIRQRLCELFRELQLNNVDILIRCEGLINS